MSRIEVSTRRLLWLRAKLVLQSTQSTQSTRNPGTMKNVSQLFMLFCLGFAVIGRSRWLSRQLQSLVNAERAFAHVSEEQGTRPAFMAFIADDGILFRPAAVKGKTWMQANPEPASSSRSRLSWRPIFAEISSAGDLGYTTGPWEFKTENNDAKPVAWGDYMTIWKRQADAPGSSCSIWVVVMPSRRHRRRHGSHPLAVSDSHYMTTRSTSPRSAHT